MIAETELALPPASLRVRVGASKDEQVFRGVGSSLAQTVAWLAPQLAGSRVLDFGCGCGRVLRYLAPAFPSASWHGVDLDQEAIGWCREELGDLAVWESCGEWPPLPFPASSFDVIYAISVFTHVPEAMQLAWLRELARVLADGGLLIVSVYSEMLHAILRPAQRQKLLDAGIFYGRDGGTAGLPPSYQTCFHTRAYVRETWSQHLAVTDCVGRAFFHSQDAILLRHKGGPHGG